jgi:alpha-L-fucosidase 2
MDLQIFRDLFDHCLDAARVLGIDDGFTARIASARDRLLPMKVGSRGNIQEWARDFIEADIHHRHTSHLFGLHPGAQITPEEPALFNAAKRTLEIRGDDGTGWSLAWKICFRARLLEGGRAHDLMRALLRPVATDDRRERYDSGGGVYASLLAAHPPFQIDANFGYVAGVIEMLLQSHRREADGRPILHLLPALPSAWPTGSVTGLRARGGFTVDMTWASQKLSSARIVSESGTPFRIRHAEKTSDHELPAGTALAFKP